MPFLPPNEQHQSTEGNQLLLKLTNNFYHTHPFNGPLSKTTWVSRYQKGKTSLDFSGARDSEWQWHQLGHMRQHLALDRQPCQHPTAQFFYRPDALPVAQPTASKH